MDLDDEALQYMIHHVFLPPKLPGNGDDKNGVRNDGVLLEALERALGDFATKLDPDQRPVISIAQTAIRRLLDGVDEETLLEALSSLPQKGGVLPIFVSAQNAAILVRHELESIVFEAFELSPPNKDVMSTNGRLKRCFPGPAIAINLDVFNEPSFQRTLAQAIAKMSSQAATEMVPKSKKAGKFHDETRDTISPALVTRFLMSFLEAAGRPATISRIWKNTREEVLWSQAFNPWRRAPVWLLARVAIQLVFSRSREAPEELYKEFMIHFMATILDHAHSDACSANTPSHVLHCMICKISKRLLKLDGGPRRHWLPVVEKRLAAATQLLEKRWAKIGEITDPLVPTSSLKTLNWEADAVAQLPELDNYLKMIDDPSQDKFRSDFNPPSFSVRLDDNDLPCVGTSKAENIPFHLAALEIWVASNLDAWLDRHLREEDTCARLSTLIQEYHGLGSQNYAGNPEGISLMVLSILELWVACDKAATERYHALLPDYDPQVPYKLLQSLILPLKTHMERLLNIEGHLQGRERARRDVPSVFAGFGEMNSFSVRFYEQSHEHQALKQRIEEVAGREKRERITELNDMKDQYRDLMRRAETLVCENIQQWHHRGYYYEVHSSSCRRCLHRNKALALKISVHEWPLPREEFKARSTVFEIDCPEPFNHWRDATMFIISNVLKSEYRFAKQPRTEYAPSTCLGDFIRRQPQRIRLLSEAKPHVVSHRRQLKITPDLFENEVCVNNGLVYHYYDSHQGCFVSEMQITDELGDSCTYQLGNESGSGSLQQFVTRPHCQPNGPEPNLVLARQSECPTDMSLEEFKSLATIPLGTRTQWPNILVQLWIPSVDFKKFDTSLVLLQASHQAGPPSGTALARESHQDLCSEAFGLQLISGLQTGLDRIKENWQSRQALCSFTALAARLLSLTNSSQVSRRALRYLHECRKTACNWSRILRSKAREATDEDHRNEFLVRTFDASHACAGTFDVDDAYLEEILDQESEAAMFVESCITIQETSRSALKVQGQQRRLCNQRWHRLSCRAFPVLLVNIAFLGNACLDIAIQRVWPVYRAAAGWRSHSGSAEHWLITNTVADASVGSQQVCYNLLTGELLVDGFPLSRLPATFEKHGTYETLFGRSTIEVMRSSVQGMAFSAIQPYRGYTVHFGLHQYPGPVSSYPSSDLMMLCIDKDGNMFDLLPQRIFQGHMPHSFVREHVHWRGRSTGNIELRPISQPWIRSMSHWQMQSNAKGWHVVKAGDPSTSLISLESPTYTELGRIFNLVELKEHIHVLFRGSEGIIDVELPRLKLAFLVSLNSTEMKSRQFPGMYLDENIRIGTLVGLRSKLVLRDERNSRLVLVPNGTVSWRDSSTAPGHVCVEVNHGTSTKVYPFHLDTHLGRILDNGTLQSKLSLCYLHALTSYCLPDSLTRKTGTEQALEILGSAAVRSFGRLTEEEVDALHRIGKLTPQRTYYPPHLKEMQEVHWDHSLSPLSQHGDLLTRAKSVLGGAASLEFFYQSRPSSEKPLRHGEETLIERDLIRSSVFRRSGFGAEHHSTAHDQTYHARPDCHQYRQRELSVFTTVSRTLQGLLALQSQIPGRLRDHLWDLLKCDPATLGPYLPGPPPASFDAGRLEDWRKFLAEHWCQLHHVLKRGGGQTATASNRFQIAMFLATLAFARDMDHGALQILTAICASPTLARVEIPDPGPRGFELGRGRAVERQELVDAVRLHLKEFHQTPEYSLSQRQDESYWELWNRREATWERQKERTVISFVDALSKQWPCRAPCRPTGSTDFNTYINTIDARAAVLPHFQTWWDNHLFYEYLGRIEQPLLSLSVKPMPGPASNIVPPPAAGPRRRANVTVEDLFTKPAPLLLSISPDLSPILSRASSEGAVKIDRLSAMVDRLAMKSTHEHEQAYVADLRRSLRSLDSQRPMGFHTGSDDPRLHPLLVENLKFCQENETKIFGCLVDAVRASVGTADTNSSSTPNLSLSPIAAASLSPIASPTFFLGQLTRDRWARLSSAWRQAIVVYGLAIAGRQYAERLLRVWDNKVELNRELQNTGHRNWTPMDYPDSLLMEVESGILIRDVQEEIASQMRSPPRGSNAVMQLNMGEGKSSVIVPIVSAALADGSKLVRVVVAKPQSRQMLQMLVSKLGGLVNRQIYHMPFSRSVRVTLGQAGIIRQTYTACRENGGVMLVQPEHILSFKLMGIESILSDQPTLSKMLLGTQHMFDTCSRDIVDESDENFSVKFELIYTIGTQQPVEFAPDRWTRTQSVLKLVAKLAPGIKEDLPLSVHVVPGPPGSFPSIRLIRKGAYELLCTQVATEICSLGLPGFPVARQTQAVRDAVFTYITKSDLTPSESGAMERGSAFSSKSTMQYLLLLRGLLAGGVLWFVFGQKRWRVNFGLDPSRQPPTRLVVPFRAKDSPTLRSEFSHPDVVIVLTCLSYYYGGLEDADLFLAFEHLVKSDQADVEYGEWVKDATPDLPDAFRRLVGINLQDRFQCKAKVFPHLRRGKAVVDYFLSHIVFPKEVREFPHKLSASGWDIGQVKTYPTTGFSGTNDSRHLLPLDVTHLDLEEQRHTNALTLHYLLQPENAVRLIPEATRKTSFSDQLLQYVVDAESDSVQVQVILDVGAQILEHTNEEVAQAWLERTAKIGRREAVIFFNDDDAICVRDRKGYVELFQTSHYASQPELCYVFLDEAHTRGTDLKLPEHYRAAVTLGASITKDRLVQACMRMRKLGKGQSVVFCIPAEIQTKILAVSGKSDATAIDTSDVLFWSIHETYVDLRGSMPLWAAQGTRFLGQSRIWQEAKSECGFDMQLEQAERFREEDAPRLETRYKPLQGKKAANCLGEFDLDANDPKGLAILDRCKEFEGPEAVSATLQEEQERELSPEIEQERQVERPPPMDPCPHRLHNDLLTFVASGNIPPKSPAFMPAFSCLADTSSAEYLDVAQFPEDLLVTFDFAKTVKLPGRNSVSDAYQRPAQWILTSNDGKNGVAHVVIISPFEAQHLIPKMKEKKAGNPAAFLHLYAPRYTASVSRLDHLKLYTFPEPLPQQWELPIRLRLQVNLFCGQLHFSSYEEYSMACEFLGLASSSSGEEEVQEGSMVVGADGFVAGRSRFGAVSPVPFFRVLFTKIRRNCEGIDKTHWGRVMNGEVLTEADF